MTVKKTTVVEHLPTIHAIAVFNITVSGHKKGDGCLSSENDYLQAAAAAWKAAC